MAPFCNAGARFKKEGASLLLERKKIVLSLADAAEETKASTNGSATWELENMVALESVMMPTIL